jgi:hypothetical protein
VLHTAPAMDETSPTPFAALMALGFLIGCAGHLYKSPATVAVGIAIAFAATAVAFVVYLG